MFEDWQAMAAELTGDIRSLRGGDAGVRTGHRAGMAVAAQHRRQRIVSAAASVVVALNSTLLVVVAAQGMTGG